MTIEDLRRFRNAEPFRPFRVVLSDGRKLLVRAPEKIGWHPSGNLLTIYTQGDNSDTLNIESVVHVQAGTSRGSQRPAK
jgi:hypothetical protein